MQIASVLSLYLPTSKYHATLSKLPAPDQTNPTATNTFDAEMAVHRQSLLILQEVVTLTEEAEQIAIEKEWEKRRTRLDSASKSREALRNEVGVEIWRDSKVSLEDQGCVCFA
jgi:superkiller protein 3